MKGHNVITSLVAAIVLTLGFAAPAKAVTECQSTVAFLWTGDAGNAVIFFASGLNFVIFPSDPNFKNILATASLALALQKPYTVRFTASGVSCTGTTTRTDVVGTYIWN